MLSFQELILSRTVVLSGTGRIRLWSQAAPAVSRQRVWSFPQGKREGAGSCPSRESLFRDTGCHMSQATEPEIFLFSETPNHFLLKLKERCSHSHPRALPVSVPRRHSTHLPAGHGRWPPPLLPRWAQQGRHKEIVGPSQAQTWVVHPAALLWLHSYYGGWAKVQF